ncbi:hypothetical protein J3R83DRAFT_4413 [Lanmaoa asiatica]|nr:hypothetical protein J3R83DRAFT_4413 [Lanmaoa asiatica]
MSVTGSMEVAVVIAAPSCGTRYPDVTQTMGNVLYSGPYDPQVTNGAPNPSQNFTNVDADALRKFHGSPQLAFTTTSLEVVGAPG